MRRRSSVVDPSETTGSAIARTQSLPNTSDSDSSSRRLFGRERRESLADRLKAKLSLKKDEPSRSRSQSVGSKTAKEPTKVSSPPDPKPAPRKEPKKASPSTTSSSEASSTAGRSKPRITKRVGFALSVLQNNPPQQIPPLKPRKGSIEVVNGEVKVPIDRSKNWPDFSYIEPSHQNISTVAATRAHENANRLHSSLTKGGFLGLFKDDEEPVMGKLKVDGDTAPVTRVATTDADVSDSSDDEGSTEQASPTTIYTHCCHLREILPIKSMLKQLQNQVSPIPELHIVNVKPTMVELLAFTDFLRVVPVVWVRMDTIVLEPEMIRILLASLVHSTHLTKLSFHGTPLNPLAWSYLCEFISLGKKVFTLDISSHHKSHRVEPFDRRNVDWTLLATAMARCKSIDSLVLSGTKIPLDKWKDLMARGFPQGRSLAMADNCLSREYLEAIVDWLCDPKGSCKGLDLAGNDMHDSYDLLRQLLYFTGIERINASHTNLIYDKRLANILTSEMADQSPLMSIELNGNKGMFPEVLEHLISILPHFDNLRRLEINSCGLNSSDVVLLCQAFVRCKSLAHISLLDNEDLNETAAAALCVVASTLRSVVQVDVETEKWPESFQNQLATYCIRNINSVGKAQEEDTEACEILSFEQELANIMRNFNTAGNSEIPPHVFDKIVELRNDCRYQLANLLELRQRQTLTVQEQENMFKFFFYDASIDRLICKIRKGLAKAKGGSQNNKLTVPDNADNQEDVKTLDTPQGPLSRTGSSSSVASLKQLEEEEGTFHKLNTWLMRKGPGTAASDDPYSRDSLRAIFEKEKGVSDATIQQIKHYTAKDLARDIENDPVV